MKRFHRFRQPLEKIDHLTQLFSRVIIPETRPSPRNTRQMTQPIERILADRPLPRLRPTTRRLRHDPNSRQVLDDATRGQDSQ